MSILQSLRSYFKEVTSCSSRRKRPEFTQGHSTIPHLVEPLIGIHEQPALQEEDMASVIKAAIRPLKGRLQKISQIQEMGFEDLTERLTRIEMALKTSRQTSEASSKRASKEQCKGLIALADCLFYTSRQIDDPDTLSILQEHVDAALTVFGISRLPLENVPFNDQYHEAREIGHDPQQPNNWVLETLRPGYLYNNILLRPAWVVVNQEEQAGRCPNKNSVQTQL